MKRRIIVSIWVNSLVSLLLLPVLVQAASPIITSYPPLEVTVGDTYQYQVEANDPEGGDLTYELFVLPAGMTISPTGLVTWVPTLEQVGAQTFKVITRDQENLEAYQYHEVNVIDPNNNLPVITQEPITEVTIDNTYTYDLQAADADGDPLTYRADSWPMLSGLAISDSGVLTWTPVDRDDAGRYWISVEVNDGQSGITKKQFELSVIDPTNNAPVINAIPLAEIAHGETYIFDPQATDADGDTLTYEFGTWPFGLGVDFNVDTGVVTWAPSREHVGENWFSLKVHDGHLGKDEVGFKLTVTDPDNNAPVFTSIPITQAIQSELYEYPVSVSDADGDDVTLTLVHYPDGMILDTVTNTLSWNPQQVAPNGVTVKLDASDNYGGKTRQQFDIIVSEGGSVNNPPVASDQSITIAEDANQTITLAAVDPEGQALTYSVLSQPLSGSLSGSGAEYTYTPDANFNGIDSFTFVASDGALTSNIATVSINVAPVNDAPFADNLDVQTDEDTSLEIQLSGSDTENDPLTFTVAIQPTNGTLSGTAPDLTYTPAENFNGSDNFTYSVNDGTSSSGFATVSITVNPFNDAPAAENLAAQTPEETPVAITLIGNDSDDDSLTYSVVAQPANGVLSGTAPNLTYTPVENFTGNDSFTYSVNDGTADSNIATVTIVVDTVNDAPVAQDINAQLTEDSASAIILMATDADLNNLTYQVITPPLNGVLSGTAPNLTYVPNTNYFGNDSFSYRANDGTVDSNTATVSLTILSVNDSPTAQNLTGQTSEDIAVEIILVGSDPEGDNLSFVIDTQPVNGVLSGTIPNVTYTPNANFNGNDSFTYHVNDGQVDSAIATVSIMVTALNDAPEAQSFSLTATEDTPRSITLQGSDPEGDPLTYDIISQPQNGSLSGSGQNLTYTPATNFSGSDSFTYRVSDGQTSSAIATVSITVGGVNDTPTAQDLTIQTAEETSVAITLSGSDDDNDPLTFAVITQPTNGVLFGTAPNLSYLPNINFVGNDSFTFQANDGQSDSNTATVTITVTNTNDAPVAQNFSTSVDEDANTIIDLVATDNDGDALTFEVLTQPTNGSITLSGAQVTYTPNANYNGSDSFTYLANDGTTNSNTAIVSITVNPTNDAPTADNASATTEANQAVSITLVASDIDGNVLAYNVVTQPQHGSVTITDNIATYTPNNGFAGEDTFTYRANDGVLDSNSANIQVTVIQSNAAPQITSQPNVQATENTLYQYQVTASDPNSSDTLTYRLNSSPVGATINAATGLIEWLPDTTQAAYAIDDNPYCLMSSESQLDERFADIIFAVDQSRSMGGETEWMQTLVPLLDANLVQNTIGTGAEPNLFGLVGFDGSPSNFEMDASGALMADSSQFYTASQTFYANGRSGDEDGWSAINQALQYPFRSASSKNMILITDEDRDNLDASLTFESVQTALQNSNVILNAVVNANFVCEDTRPALGLGQNGVGYVADGLGGFELCENATVSAASGTTEADYVNLALALDGAAWDLNVLRAGGRDAQSFVKALMSIKVEEIERQFEATPQADVVVESIFYTNDTIEVVIKNRGLVDISSPIAVELLDEGNVITSLTVNTLLTGGSQTLSHNYANATGTIDARVIAGSLNECVVDNNQLTAWTFEVAVEDEGGLTDIQRYDITVTNTNQAPQITSTAPTVAPFGSEYSYQVQVNDPDTGDGLTYQLSSAPLGMVIDAVTGIISFKPTAAQQGTHDVTVAVTDVNGLTDQQGYVLIVDNSYDALRFISEPEIRAIQNEEYRYQAEVESDETAELLYTLLLSPVGMSLNDETGEIIWQVPSNAPGREYPLVLQVSDQFGNVDIQAYELIGDLVPTAPVLTFAQVGARTVGSQFVHSFQYTDTNYQQNLRVNRVSRENLAVFSLLNGPENAILETEIATQISGAFGSSCTKVCGEVDFSRGNLTWTPQVTNPGTPFTRLGQAGVDLFCRASDAINTEFEATQRLASNDFRGRPIAGPLYDSNNNGQLDDGDRRFLFAFDWRSSSRFNPKRLVAIDPITLKAVWRSTASVSINSRGTLIDLEGDASAELLFFDGSNRLMVLNSDGTLRWRSTLAPASGNFVDTQAMPVDLDNDGIYEILYGPYVFDANGNLLWQFSTDYPNSTFGRFAAYSTALPVDFDLDGVSEVVYFNEVRDAQGNLLWTIPSRTTNSSSSVRVNYAFANLDADPEPELVVNEAFFTSSSGSYRPYLRLVDNDGSLIWETNEGILGTGNLAIVDVDNDGDMEIYSANNGALFDHTGTTIWQNGNRNGVRYSNGLIADINGDGSLEIIDGYTDAIYILDAASGLLINQFTTRRSFARVDDIMYADIDNDNQGEIILTSRDAPLTILDSVNNNWADASSVYAYNQQSIGEINSQLRINSMRGNYFSQLSSVTPTGNTPIADLLNQANQADVFVNAVYADYQDVSTRPEEWRVFVNVGNRGAVAAENLLIELYTDDPNNAANKFGELTVANLNPNAVQNLTFPLTDDAVLGSEIFARVSSTTAECRLDNNLASGVTFDVQVTDSDGLFDRAKISVGGVASSGIRVTSTALSQATVGEQYQYQIEATGNGSLTYSLESRLSGITVNPQTGLITWIPTADQVSLSHTFSVSIEDTVLGNNTEHRFAVRVLASTAPNTDPVITSTPITQSNTGQAYSYPVVATDAENHNITYSLTTAPGGMTINGLSGLISWPASTVGDYDITVRATDELGAFVEQSYTLTVSANSAPVITSNPLVFVRIDRNYSYQIQATDPDGQALTYTLLTAPTGMSVSSTGLISWLPTAQAQEPVSVRVSDGTNSVTQSWTIEVLSAEDALTFNMTVSAEFVNEGDTVIVNYFPFNVIEPYTITATLDGQPITVTNNQSTITATGIGSHTVEATLTDPYDTLTASASYIVRDPSDLDAPVVTLVEPLNTALVTAPTAVIGSVSDANLSSWRLSYAKQNTLNFVTLAEGTTNVTEQALATFDPTLLDNGQYVIVLEASDASGQSAQVASIVAVEGELKVGNFSFTVEDINVPLAGLPIRITRTYDSRRKAEDLDFGYGWSIGYQDISVDEPRDPGEAWALNEYPGSGPGGLLTNYCVEPQGTPQVAIKLPTGEVERFDIAASPRCNLAIPILDVALEFNPVGDNQSTLEALEQTNGRLIGNDLADISTAQVLNPNRYRLTTRNGYIYTLDETFGIETVTDPNGNTLTYNDSGIVHSSGKSVSFVRDSQGRIAQVVDPAGNAINYAYDSNGDLITVTERDGAVTTHSYFGSNCATSSATADCHLLDDMRDPLGRRLVKNIYDASGRLIAQEDQNGERTEFNHDVDGRQSIVTDRNGNTTVFGYDERGNVLTQVDALGNTRSFTYDANDNQLTQTDELGNTTIATYDGDNNQLTQVDALGNTLTFAYNARGQETEITDARGNAFNNTYDTVGNLLSVEDPEGNLAGNNINAQGLVSSTVDAEGNTTTYTYDSEGNKLTETDSLGTVTTYTYDDNNNVLTETRTRTVNGILVDEVTSYVYDNRNRVTQTTDALGNITQMEYNLAGQESARIDALGRRTEMDYDVYGNLLETRYPDGTTESHTYDPENNKLSTRDRLGRTTTFGYDALNRQISMTYPDGSSTQTEYDAAGRVSAEIDERGNRTEFEYDAANRRTATIDALGNRHEFAYDADGNLTSETDARGNTISYTYNSLDQRTLTTFADGSTMGESFDALSRRTQMVDQAGRATDYAYDDLGRLLTVTDALGQVTSYTYDEQGNKLTQTDAEGRTTTWTYDALGRVLTRTLPLGQIESFQYDANGNMTQKTDFNGAVHTYTYDVNDRLTQVDYADGSQETMTYDAVGNRTGATISDSNGTRTWSYTYDSRNRLTREVKPNGDVIDYSYDAAGNKASLSTTQGTQISTETYSYDVLNRLSDVTVNGQSTLYAYDPVGNRSVVSYANGNITLYTYDALNRLTDLSTENGLGGVLQSFTYTLDPTGRRTQIDESSGRSTSYTYDELYRLTQESITDSVNGNYNAQYSYDQVGNRTQSIIDGVTTAYNYDNNDRISQYDGTTYTYDDNGNTLTESLDGVTKIYTYNSQNELVSVDDGLDTTNYQYNIDGIRNGQSSAGVTTDYLVDHNRDYAQVLVESDNGTAVVSYTYGDDLISQTRGTVTFTYHYDGLGSTRGLSDATGSLTDTYDYEAFGEVLNQSGGTANNYLFTGEQFDQNLNQYYLRARYYNQANARFTQMDTWEGRDAEPVTLNKYLYGHSDPANFTDPTGNFGLASFGAANNIRGILATTSVPSYQSFIAATGVGLLAAGLLNENDSVVEVLQHSTAAQKMLELEREKLESDVEERSRTGQLVYHYTNRVAARAILATQCMFASKGFNHPDGIYRPPGAYATLLPPWSAGWTQRALREVLYASPRNQDVSAFVAIESTGFVHLGVESYKYGPRGSCVPVDAVYQGSNLMLPN